MGQAQAVVQHVETVRKHRMNNVIMEINLVVYLDVSLISVLLVLEQMGQAQVVVQHVEIVSRHQMNNAIMEINLAVHRDV